MHSPKRSAGLVVLVLAAMTALACNGTPTPTPTPPPPDFEVAVALSEWAVAAAAAVGSGEVRFDVTNGGGIVHQLAIYRGGSLSGDSIDGGTLVARTTNIQVGGTDTLQESLEAGDYWLVCPIPGHTAFGMSAQLTVEAR